MNFQAYLEHYRSLDPQGWIDLYRMVPVWAGLLLVLAGAALLLFGGGRAFRLVAGPLGAIVGGLWIPLLGQKMGIAVPENVVALGAMAVFFVLGVALPPAMVFFAVGLPAGFFAGNLAGPSDWMLGFFPALLAVGTLSALFSRWVGVVVSSVVGAWVLIIGLLSTFHLVHAVAVTVASQPAGVLAAAALFAIAGTLFQLFVRPSPEQAERIRIDKLRAKKRHDEKRALEKRWAGYSDE